MGKQVKFIHSADLHLGSPLKSLGQALPSIKHLVNDASYIALERTMDAAIRHKVDFVIFSGDIYDQESRSVRANQHFIAQLERLNKEKIAVYIIYGNHDSLGSSVEFFRFPENVHVYPFHEPEIVEVCSSTGQLIARVIGQSYRNRSESRKLYDSYNPPDDSVVNIGVLHTGLNPSSNNYVPCSVEDLKGKSFIDYWALGHIHKQGIINSTHPVIAYPGIPQGRDSGEPGLGGCFLVELEPQKAATVMIVPTSSIIWCTQEAPIGEDDDTVDDLEDLLVEQGRDIIDRELEKALALEIAPGEVLDIDGYVVRWLLTGRGKVHKNIIVGNEADLSETLTERLRQKMGNGDPFLWTETVRFSTNSPISNLDQVLKHDIAIQTLSKVAEELKNLEDRKEIINTMGNIWEEKEDPEDIRKGLLGMDEDIYKQIIDKAYKLSLERIFEGRERK